MPRYALLPSVLAIFLGTMASPVPAAEAPAGTVTMAPTVIEGKFRPRSSGDTAVVSAFDPAAALYAMTHTVFEGEAWGEIPELGLSVQDMTPFAGKWSGNKQIFWNASVKPVFQWDFAAPKAKSLTFDMTAAPDYGTITIRLFCFRKTPYGTYMLKGTLQRIYDGYATSVRRKTTAITLLGAYNNCYGSDAYRLIFSFTATAPGRRYGGIDRIVVTK